jgi:signal transduction histidine kinase
VEATAAAEAANASKSRFLSSVSHELRTPLTSVIGFSKLISKRLAEVVLPAIPPTDDPKLQRAMRQVTDNLAIIIEEGERLTTLINDTLDLAKIESGRMDWRDEPVAIGEIITRATSATASLLDADQAGPTLVIDVADPLPTINGDRDRLIQVVINLISNAVKFTPTGTITVAAHQTGAAIEVAVTDTGIGIAPEDQAAVFEPFAQASSDTLPTTPQGTGLGLPISREIVEHHGGRLWLESEPGRGSRFWFSLPIQAGPDGQHDSPVRPGIHPA